METDIIEHIVTSVEFWKDYEKIGEEVRPLSVGPVGVEAGGLEGVPSPDGFPIDISGLEFNRRIVSISDLATLDAFSQISSIS